MRTLAPALLLVLIAGMSHVHAQDDPGLSDQELVQTTIKQLQNTKDREGRLAILEEFRKHPNHANNQVYIPILKQLLRSDPDPKIREAVAEPLAYMVYANPPRLCPLELLQAYVDLDENVRSAAITYSTLFT